MGHPGFSSLTLKPDSRARVSSVTSQTLCWVLPRENAHVFLATMLPVLRMLLF